MKRHNVVAGLSIVRLRKVYAMSTRACTRAHDVLCLEEYCEGHDADSSKRAMKHLLDMEEIHLKLEREINKREMRE